MRKYSADMDMGHGIYRVPYFFRLVRQKAVAPKTGVNAQLGGNGNAV